MGLVSKFFGLPPTDRRLIVSATLVLGAIKLGIALLSFQTLRNLLAKAAREGSYEPRNSDPGIVERIVWAVVTASRHMPFAVTCLPQAMAAQVLLARRGYPARIHFGVAKDVQENLEAHAWVECQGRVVIGGDERERFTPLPALEREGR